MSEQDLHFNDLRGTAATKLLHCWIQYARDRRNARVGGGVGREDHSPLRRPRGRHQGEDQEAGEQRMNKSCKTDDKTVSPISAKYWSGRRESNPRMQLGKLHI